MDGEVNSGNKKGDHWRRQAERTNDEAIVTEMAPEEVATHLKLDADKYMTHSPMQWQVANCVTLELPYRLRHMWTDNLPHGEPGEQEELEYHLDCISW